MKTAVIIQGRMGSSRLSGKIMRSLCGKTVLAHDIERVSMARGVDEVIIATTTNPRDEIIAEEAKRCGAKVYRGSEEDVLKRYYGAALENQVDTVIRVTSDCPLIDPHIMEAMIQIFNGGGITYMTNQSHIPAERTYPRGLDTELFTFSSLEDACENAGERYQREHVTPYIIEHSEKRYYYKSPVNYSKYRWTLDTEEDWELIEKIYGYLYHGAHNFFLEDMLRLMREHPELERINAGVEQKKWKE